MKRGRPVANAYSVRSTHGSNGQVYGITVPAWMGKLVPKDAKFAAEWHQDGILLRLVDTTAEQATPEWLNGSKS